MPEILVRETQAKPWILKPERDPCWNVEDWGRAATLEMRWIGMGVSEKDRRELIPCAIWKAKFPGLQYNPFIESKLRTLAV
jgi:hypothetical protein